MTNEERKNKYMNRNIKIFPTYLTLTWDIMLVWTISTLFLTNQKGLSYSEIIMLEAFSTLFAALFAIPMNKLFQKFSSVTASRISSLGYIACLLLYIFGETYPVFVLARVCLAFAYSIKSVKDNLILTESLRVVNRDKEYERIYGKSVGYSYLFEAIGAIVVTYVYQWNVYLCFWLSLLIVLISLVLSCWFTSPSKFQKSNIDLSGGACENKKENEKPTGYLKIITSGFMLSMICYLFLFRGVVSVDVSAFKVFLQNMTDSKTIPLWMFGYVFAFMKICVAISTKYQFKYNLKFGVRSLIIFNVLLVLSFVINGVMMIVAPTSIITFVVVTISSIAQCSVRMPNQIFLNNYMQKCLDKKDLDRAYSIRSTVEYLSCATMTFVFSSLMNLFNQDYAKTNIVYIAIFAVPMILSLVWFLWTLCKVFARKNTIIEKKYTED